MRHADRIAAASLVFLALAALQPAQAQQGLKLPALEQQLAAAQRWQARVQLSSLDQRRLAGRSSVISANLLGDYYLTGSLLGQHTQGGLRTTGGMLLGASSYSESSAGLALRNTRLGQGAALSVGQRSIGLLNPTLQPGQEGNLAARPYLGIGYTGQSLRGGWGFSADLGLVRFNPRDEQLSLGRASLGSPSLDELLQELRLRPVLQLGLNYSF